MIEHRKLSEVDGGDQVWLKAKASLGHGPIYLLNQLLASPLVFPSVQQIRH
jgi:hypothetical protein